MIAPFWTDLVASNNDFSGVFLSMEEGCVRVLWKNMRISDSNFKEHISIELVLYASENSTAQNESGIDFMQSNSIKHQDQGNKHILLNYLELPLDLPHGGEGHKSKDYVAGVNSGNGICGHHAFHVQMNSVVAYLKMK